MHSRIIIALSNNNVVLLTGGLLFLCLLVNMTIIASPTPTPQTILIMSTAEPLSSLPADGPPGSQGASYLQQPPKAKAVEGEDVVFSLFFKAWCGWSTGCGEGEVVCAEFGGKEECSTRQRDGGGWVCWPCDFVWWSVWGRSIHDTKEYFGGGSRPVFVCLHINTLNCSSGRRDQTQHSQRAGWERIRGAKILV